ncbi:MAG: hypothetical protein R2709_06770 [Marmoricola sp.]
MLHLGGEIEVDAHDPTDNLREQVIQRNAVCVFPGAIETHGAATLTM